jgi:hypothetical protein
VPGIAAIMAPARAAGKPARLRWRAGPAKIDAMRTPTTSPLAALLGAGLALQLLAPPVVLAPCGAAAPQGRGRRQRTPDVPLTPFVGELGAARAHAAERNAPLLVHLVLEGEEQNDAYRDTLLPDPELRAASAAAVVLVANNGDHEPATVFEEVEGRRVESQVCSKYPWFATCADHRLPWQSLYEALREENGDLGCPQTVLELPGGEVHWRKNDRNPPSKKELLVALEAAVKAAGPGLDEAQLATVRRLRAEARRSTEGRLLGAAWAEWTAVLAIARGGRHHEEGLAARAAVEEAMRAAVADAAGRLVPGEAAEAYGELHEAVRTWGDAPPAEEARKLMRRAEKDDAIEAEIEAWNREREATELLEAARAAAAEQSESGLRKALRKLFSKKYEGTRAQARGLEEFPEHAPGGGAR